jgi:hypothetical protein
MKTDQKGFSAVEGLLLLVLVGIISFAGWFVWHSQKNANNSYNNALADSSSSKTTAKPPAANYYVIPVMEQWKAATLPTEKISFKYPPESWKLDIQHYTQGSGPGAYHDGDLATLTSPNGFKMTIGTGNIGDGSSNDPMAKVFDKEPFTLNGQTAFAVITGVSSNGTGAQNVEATSKDATCAINCRLSSVNSQGTIWVFGGFYDTKRALNKNYNPVDFKNSPTVKQALTIIKSLSY